MVGCVLRQSARLGLLIDEHSLTDPSLNIAAAALLCDFWEHRARTDCYQPKVSTDPGSTLTKNKKGHFPESQEMPSE